MNPKLGFIGFGRMAKAIYTAITESGLVKPASCSFVECNATCETAVLRDYPITASTIEEMLSQCSVILFCVKPQNIRELLEAFPQVSFEGTLFISILAGTKLSLYQELLGKETAVCRVMPNIPATIRSGMAGLSFNAACSSEQKDFALSLLNTTGAVEVVTEDLMDVVTGISGSGPAFVYRLAHQMALAGKQSGMPYEQALTLAAQTFVGAGSMLLQSKRPPSDLIKEIASPNGTTVAGLESFDRSSIDHDIQKVVLATIQRSRELGA